MQSIPRVLSILLLFCGAWFGGRAQSMVPAIQQTQSMIKQAEKDGDVIDAAVYDYIFKDNNSVYTYDFYFYSSDSYTIRVLGDESRNTNLMIRVLRLTGGSWQPVKQSQGTGRAYALLPFKPTSSERYRVEVSGSLTGTNTSSCFGLLIVRAE